MLILKGIVFTVGSVVGGNEGFVWFLGLWFQCCWYSEMQYCSETTLLCVGGLEVSFDSEFFFPRSPLLASFSLPSSLQETLPPLPEVGLYPSSTSNLMNIFLLVEVLWGTDVWFISISVTYGGVPVFLPCVLPPWGPTAPLPQSVHHVASVSRVPMYALVSGAFCFPFT